MRGSGRRHHWLGKTLLVVVVLLLAYPVAGTLMLWTGAAERLLKSEDLEVQIASPAWTIVPGRLHLDGVRLLVNGETQFILSARDVAASVNPIALFARRFSVLSLDAEDVSYRMRVQMDPTELDEPRVKAFPPLDGLPGLETLNEEKAEEEEPREKSWTVEVRGIDVAVRELWFLEYRYRGDGKLSGGFVRGPTVMQVDTAVQDLGPGKLTFGADRIISHNFRGRVEAEIPRMNPAEHVGQGFFSFVNGHASVDADIESVDAFGAYASSVELSQGKGALKVRLSMQQGALDRDSSITYSTEKVAVAGDRWTVSSDWQLDFGVRENPEPRGEARDGAPKKPAEVEKVSGKEGLAQALPQLYSHADATYVSFPGSEGNPFTIQVRDHEQMATLDSTRLGEADLEAARVHFPIIRTEDLDDLGSDSEEATVKRSSGVAQGSLTLNRDDEGKWHGPFEAEMNDVALAFEPFQTRLRGTARSRVSVDPGAGTVMLGDFTVRLRDVVFLTGDERIEGWWMTLSSEQLWAKGLPPSLLTTDISIKARDAEPVIEALAENDQLPGIVAKLVSLRDLAVKAEVRKRGEALDVMLDNLESAVIDFSGRYYSKGDDTKLALVIGGTAVSLGIDRVGPDRGLEPFADTDWLNTQLKQFPDPPESVRPQKP